MTQSQVLEFVRNQCKNGGLAKADDALHYFKVMIRLNPLPSTPIFIQLLGAAVRMKHYAIAIHMIERMDSMAISRNLYVLSILINCLSHMKMSDPGFSVLTKMFKLGVEPSVVTLNTLLNGLCEEGKTARALTLVEEMWGKGFKVDDFTCGVMVKRLCRSGNTSTAVRFMRDMEEKGCELNVVMCSTIIDSYCKEGLAAQGCPPNGVMYGIIIRALLEDGQKARAMLLLGEMVEKGFSEDASTAKFLGASANSTLES
ncbi:pentatricopeptide repeat-containing protein At1g12300, mitochondrial-like [Syzygium oleosum]|uniref:pentatricopeptide repeat-containing protein At1g12300, mitochondrial-like n=1 Tax=Syzygium oleosum TaxID=219896 RepID=UPI0011D244B3|nr:pentatricopeptide repeat-containing protein At1g12300, mitochondrial-like [Syzygium oleosum]